MDAMGIIATLSLALGASFASGINLYATIGMLGLLHRYVDGFVLPSGLEVLASDWVLWPALALYCVEFVADKVPAVDSVWDTIQTFIRIPAGAVIAAGALGDVPLAVEICAGLVGGSLALGAHTTKATTRLAAHATGTSPVVSPVVSVGEDIAVVGLIALIAANPVISLFVLALMLIGCYFVIRAFWSLARRAFRGIMGLARRNSAEEAVLPTAV